MESIQIQEHSNSPLKCTLEKAVHICPSGHVCSGCYSMVARTKL